MNTPAGPIRTEAERNLALLAYGLLGVSVFFAGTTALVAVIIACWLHDAATEELSRHFRFQTRIFWVGVFFVAAFVVTGVSGGLLFLRDVMANHGRWQGVDLGRELFEQVNELRYNRLALGLLAASALSAVLGMLWIVVAPAIGFIRLASSKHIGQTAHS